MDLHSHEVRLGEQCVRTADGMVQLRRLPCRRLGMAGRVLPTPEPVTTAPNRPPPAAYRPTGAITAMTPMFLWPAGCGSQGRRPPWAYERRRHPNRAATRTWQRVASGPAVFSQTGNGSPHRSRWAVKLNMQ
jgi:hypothetical protein